MSPRVAWAILCFACCFSGESFSQEIPRISRPGGGGEGGVVLRTFVGGEPWPTEYVESPPLPRPSASQAQWLSQGRVRFLFYDAQKYARKYQGETRFIASYTTELAYRWNVRRGIGNRARLVIKPDFKKIELAVEHQVLLPITIAGDTFFAHPLVQHELDHVRISSDARFARLFRQWIEKDLREVVVELDQDESLGYRVIAGDQIESRVEALFERLLQLIQVRYEELDRDTRHGTLPLPDDFFPADEGSLP